MKRVRCTNCGGDAVISEGCGDFCRCEFCGALFAVERAAEFSKVVLDRTQDIKAWREYLAKQLKLQQDSKKSRDYGGVKLFAQKILSVLPNDFRAQYYLALAERYSDNDTAFVDFLRTAPLDGISADEKREVTLSVVATVEPKYLDLAREFIARTYPATCAGFDEVLDRNIKAHIQRLRDASEAERDVFICHRTAEPDQDIADAICSRLEQEGLRCWIAPRNILAGSQNYDRDIISGVENCKLFLVVAGFKSIYSEDCEAELKAAVLAGKALYSYRIDDVPYDGTFKRALAKVQWLDASDDPYAHLEQLVMDVKGILAADERERSELQQKRLAARERERQESEARRKNERERIERLERMVAGAAPVKSGGATVSSRLKRAELEISSQSYARAQKIIDEALDADPENPLAWWLLALCDMKLPDDKAVMESHIDFTANRYFKNAERFAHLDQGFGKRLDVLNEAFALHTVKRLSENLDEAERLFKLDNMTGMKEMLKRCDSAFANENSVIFLRFSDIASRYYWLRLWAKYGHSHLVCVEDITRESEYKRATELASPAQAAEYARQTETVRRNACAYLRERSKSKSNDAKLLDYLADNKGILPEEVYGEYSSLLYFRKALDSLGMTEPELERSCVDLDSNGYFMLAVSNATPAQGARYKALSEAVSANRAQKARAEAEDRQKREAAAARKQRLSGSLSIIATVVAALVQAGAVALFVLSMVCIEEEELTHAFAYLTVACALIVAGLLLLLRAHRGTAVFLAVLDLIWSIITVTVILYVLADEADDVMFMYDHRGSVAALFPMLAAWFITNIAVINMLVKGAQKK